MQNSEKSADQSMEEILASIRKIIAEEPPQAPQQTTAPQLSSANDEAETTDSDAAVPPTDDLSDILDEPTASVAKSDTQESTATNGFGTPAKPGVLAPEAQASTAQTDIPVAKSPFPQPESNHESPLMARLRGLAGSPESGEAASNNAETVGGDVFKAPSEGVDSPAEPEAIQESTPGLADSLPNAISEEAARATSGAANVPDLKSDAPVQPELSAELPSEPDMSALLGEKETAFGKNAATGVEPVAISIAGQSTDEPATDETSDIDKPSLDDLLHNSSAELQAAASVTPAETIFGAETQTADQAPQDEATPAELPMLPHQEVPETTSVLETAPDLVPETDLTITPTVAPVEAAVPASEIVKKVAAAEPQEQQAPQASGSEVSPRADLELALAALVEPVVHRWLEENVPALVEKVLAEKADKQ